MDWLALAELAQGATQSVFGEPAGYTPPGGALILLGEGGVGEGVIYEAAHVDVVLEGDVAVESTFPAAGVLLADLPGGEAEHGASLSVRGLHFSVTEIRPDGQGAALLKLKRLPSVEVSHVQDGSPALGTGIWAEGDASFFAIGTSGPAGLIFEVSTGVTFTALTLTLREVGRLDLVPASSWSLYLVNDASPALFSDANLPTTVGATFLQTIDAVPLPIGTQLVFTIDPAVVNALAASPGWTGRLAFVLAFPPYADGTFSEIASQENTDTAKRPVLSVS